MKAHEVYFDAQHATSNYSKEFLDAIKDIENKETVLLEIKDFAIHMYMLGVQTVEEAYEDEANSKLKENNEQA